MGSESKRKPSQLSVSTSSSSDDSDSNSDVSRRRPRHRKHDASSRREKERKRAREEEKRRRRRRKERKKEREKDRKHSKSRNKRSRDSDSDSALSGSDPDPQSTQVGPEFVMRDMLREFPNVGGDLKLVTMGFSLLFAYLFLDCFARSLAIVFLSIFPGSGTSLTFSALRSSATISFDGFYLGPRVTTHYRASPA